MLNKDIYAKLQNFCAYQERCIYDIKQKLLKLDESLENIDSYVEKLKDQNYLCEERYAIAFSRGHFFRNKWGKVKIRNGLIGKNISEELIEKGLEQISNSEYLVVLEDLINNKWNSLMEDNLYIRKDKVFKTLKLKGFESDLIWSFLNQKE